MSDGKEFPSDKADKFVVRFPDGMRERIRAAAEANNRSMNAEIVARLEESLSHSTVDKVAGALGGSIALELAQQFKHMDSLSKMIVQRLTKAKDALDEPDPPIKKAHPKR